VSEHRSGADTRHLTRREGAGHVVLVGTMGSGKTRVGRQLATRLGLGFVDSDEQIERRCGRTVREIFESDGEPAFRKLEAEALAEAIGSSARSVIAAAGGVVLDPRNRELLRRAAAVVWLRARPEVLATRVRDGDHRPLLGDDALGALRRLDAERAPLYEEVATAVLDVGELSPDEAVTRIVELVT
jgi:shikimate kinase